MAKISTGIYNKNLQLAIWYICNRTSCGNRNVRNYSRLNKDKNGEMIIDSGWKRTSKYAYALAIKNWIKEQEQNFKEYGKKVSLSRDSSENVNLFLNYCYGTSPYSKGTVIEGIEKLSFDIPIKWLWIAYDKILGHDFKRLLKIYSKEEIDSALGQPFTPFEVEQNNLLDEEIKKILDEFEEKNSSLTKTKEDALKAAHAAYSDAYKKILKEKDEKIAELRAQFEEMRKMMAV